MVVSSEGKFKAGDSLELFYRAWRPDAGRENKAVVALVHGAGEHSGRHANIGEYLAGEGYAVYAYDLRGHGKSPGRWGHIDRFAEYIEDTDSFLNFVRQQEPGKKVYLLGHSLGGVIAAVYAVKHPELPGLILSSAFFRIKMRVPGWKTAIGRAASCVFPTLTMRNGLSAADLSRNPEVGKSYRNDPLVHDLASVRFYTEMLTAQKSSLEHAGKLKVPVLLLYGGGDRIADPAGVRDFFENIKYPNKTLRCYESCYHEIFNETENEVVFRDIVNWLAARG